MGRRKNVSRGYVLKRQEEVKNRYYILRQPIPQIAKEMEWAVGTIHSDIKVLRERTKLKFTKDNLKDIMVEQTEAKDVIIKKLMKLAKQEEEPSRAATIWDKVAYHIKDKLDIFERLGVISKKADRIEVKVDKYEEDIKWAEEQLGLIIKKKRENKK